MANDNHRSLKVKDDENIKSKKKTVTQDASPPSSSRRPFRETPSRKQTKESPIKESPTKEDLINTRKSERLGKRKPSGTTPIKEKSEGAHEQRITTPMKMYDRRKKLDVGAEAANIQSKSSGSCHEHAPEKASEGSVSSNKKSKKEKGLKSLKQCVMDTTEDKKHKKQGLDAGGRKRKRVSTGVDKDLSKPQRIRSETGVDNDEAIEEKSSEANSTSSRDVDSELVKPDSSKSVEVLDDSDDDCSDKMGEESTMTVSKRQCKTSNLKEPLNDRFVDLEQDRTTCEAAGLAAIVEKNNGVSRTETSICIVCKSGGKLRDCNAVGCNRCYHLSCLDPPVDNVPSGNSLCPFCVKNIKSSVPLVPESIWDTREVEVSEAQGLQKLKQYFVKYKGRAHIHNQWITETQLLLEAPLLLVENSSKHGSMKWNEQWTVPHRLLKKRLLLSFEPLYESNKNSTKVLYYYYEWLVQWKGLDYEQATWESENISAFDSPEGHNLIKEYEMLHGNGKTSSDDKIEEMPFTVPIVPAVWPPGMDNIHLSYVKNLQDAWNKGQTSLIFDDQERAMRIVLFIFSLRHVTLPFLVITTSDSLSQWEAMFLKIAPCNSFKVCVEDTDEKRSITLLRVQKEGGDLAFQVLLYPVNAFIKDLNVLKAIKWEAVIVDESQSSEISSHFSHTKSLSTDKRLLVFCGPLGVSMTSYLDVLSLLDCNVISKTELDDISKLKETLSKLIAYECKPDTTSKFAEYWVPVQISKVQLEQYCSMLLSNAMALSSCSKSDTTGALHDILVSNRKCCDHPYIVDQSLQTALTKDLEPVRYLDVGIKASGKLHFLDLILPEMRKLQLRVLILFQPLSGSGKDSTSIGDILDDFVRQRFGEDSYERVDGIGILPSKKQAALNNFNKDMGRFVFLLEYRACLPSIKLSSVDTIIIFDSDWNPANDLRALQKIAIDSKSEPIMVFRLYTSSTLEEKILRLAEHNVTIDSKLQNISRSTSDALLMWGATYLFNKLDEFHSSSVENNSSEECSWDELMEEFLHLISHKRRNKDATKLIITRVQPFCGTYGKYISLPSEPDGEQPHSFWRKLLVGRNPGWKYLSGSAPRQRKRERPQYFEESPKKTNAGSDDAGRKRKKNANNITESAASKPVIEEGENGGATRVSSHDGLQSSPGDVICDEMSFKDLLKLKTSKLCEVLRLPEDVKITVEKFLIYVIENYRVDREPTSTLHSFLISLCWIGSVLLKHKLDRKQSITLANEHLHFSCKEEEANKVYSKLEPAKEGFLRLTDTQKKTNVSKDTIIKEVKVEILDSPDNHHDDVDCNQKDGEGGTISHDQNGSNTPSASVIKEKVPVVQLPVSPTSGQSVPTDLVTQKECIQDNEVQGNTSSLPEISNLQRLDAHEEPCLPSSVNLPAAENQSSSPLGEQQPDLHSADGADCQPHEPSQNEAPQVPNQAVTLTPHGSNLLNGPRSGNQNQRASQKFSDPLQAEFERLSELKDTVMKCHEAIKMKLNSDYEKELAEVIGQIKVKYEAKQKNAEAAFQLKKKEVDISLKRVVMNKVLAETFRSKCQDLTPFNPAEIRGGIQHLPQFQVQPSHGRSSGVNACSEPPSSGIQQVTELQPPLQIVNQTSKLFSATPSRSLTSTIIPTSTPTRQPSTVAHTSTRPQSTASITPTRPPSTAIPTPTIPPSTAVPTSTPTRPPSTIASASTPTRPPNTVHSTTLPIRQPSTDAHTSTRPSSTATITPIRPPSTAVPNSTPTRPPSTAVPISTPSRPPSTTVPTSTPTRPSSIPVPSSTPTRPPSTTVPVSTPSRPTPHINTITPSSGPPPNINPSARNLQGPSQIRAPAPHIRPFRPSTSVSPRELASRKVMPSQHSTTSLPMSQTSAQPSPSPSPSPPFLANHNSHTTTQNSPISLPTTSSQSSAPTPAAPAASFQLPSLYYPWYPPPATSSSQPQTSLPPMPSISISNTGLYNQTPDILSRSALDLLMDMDKQGGFHKQNMMTSPPECVELTDFGKEGGGSDLVCLLSDDDD